MHGAWRRLYPPRQFPYNAWQGFLGNAFAAEDVALPEILDDREIRSLGIGAAASGRSPMERPLTFVILVVY